MLDVEEAIQRIKNMSEEEWNRIMREALDEAHIPYSDTPGEIIFNGLPPELLGYSEPAIVYNCTAEKKDTAKYCASVSKSGGVSVKISCKRDVSLVWQSVPAAA